MPEAEQVYNTAAAFQALSKAAADIEQLEAKRAVAQTAHEKAEDVLREAMVRFNDLREQTINFFPALEAGFSLKRETVDVVDGKVRVVER